MAPRTPRPTLVGAPDPPALGVHVRPVRGDGPRPGAAPIRPRGVRRRRGDRVQDRRQRPALDVLHRRRPRELRQHAALPGRGAPATGGRRPGRGVRERVRLRAGGPDGRRAVRRLDRGDGRAVGPGPPADAGVAPGPPDRDGRPAAGQPRLPARRLRLDERAGQAAPRSARAPAAGPRDAALRTTSPSSSTPGPPASCSRRPRAATKSRSCRPWTTCAPAARRAGPRGCAWPTPRPASTPGPGPPAGWVLATDGDFNVGESSDAAMRRLVEAERESGVMLSVLGFGTGNVQDSKMETLADHGNGNYAYIDGVREAERVLVREFGGTLFAIAKDVKVQVEFNPARVAGYRLIGYENRVLEAEDFRDDAKDAGELGAGHTVTALYEVVPAGTEVPTAGVDGLRYQTAPAMTDARRQRRVGDGGPPLQAGGRRRRVRRGQRRAGGAGRRGGRAAGRGVGGDAVGRRRDRGGAAPGRERLRAGRELRPRPSSPPAPPGATTPTATGPSSSAWSRPPAPWPRRTASRARWRWGSRAGAGGGSDDTVAIDTRRRPGSLGVRSRWSQTAVLVPYGIPADRLPRPGGHERHPRVRRDPRAGRDPDPAPHRG